MVADPDAKPHAMKPARKDDQHRDQNGPALFAFCAGVWLAIAGFLFGLKLERWVFDG